MTFDTKDLLSSIIGSLERIDYIKSKDLPNIDLYMDQVTTFMDNKLRNSTRHPEEDKVLTKTMINNYAKNDLLPPPVKKKYTKEHVLVLIFIYYYKGIMSITDIQNLLTPITERFFGTNEPFNIQSIYEEVFALEAGMVESLKQDVIQKYQAAEKTFDDAPAEERDFLQLFAFICMLSFDVYVKKLMIEKLVDGITAGQEAGAHKGKNETAEREKAEKIKTEKAKAERTRAEKAKTEKK